MTLPVDGQVAKTLLTVDEYLAESRYEELTELLIQLTETHGRELVAVPVEANQAVHRYVNVATHCQRMLAELPERGRAACRKQLDPMAKRWWDAWQATRDDAELQRIVRSAFVSSVGDNALWELGQSAWDRGEYSLAAGFWRALDPSAAEAGSDRLLYPDPEFAAADVQARLILCDIFSRRFAVADRKLAAFRTRFPDAKGTLAGRDALWIDLLTDALTAARDWTGRGAEQQIATFGGTKERQQTLSAELDLGPLRWSATWPTRLLTQIGPVNAADRGPLKSFPVIDRDHVFLSDGDVIRAWNVVTGEPAWPNQQADPAVIYPPVPQELLSLPLRPVVGVPWQTLTLQQGKLYARIGSPITGATVSERADQVSELVCLDVRGGQGKLVWKVSADDLPANGPPWSFEGTPLVLGDAAYAVLYRRQPEAEFALACLDAETGDVQWLRPLGAARPSVDDAVNRVSHLLLTSGDGRLYFSTDQGTILAIAPQDGRLLWAVSYESLPMEAQHGTPAHLQSGLLPPVFAHGWLFVAPNDSRSLFCLDAASGRIVWQKRAPERLRHLIGVTSSPRQGRLIAAGNSLWAFDVQDGALAWRMIQNDPAERGYGHGVMTGQSIFWPTREWLLQVDALTGELQRKIALRTPDSPHSGGNLAVADGVLLIAEPDGLAAYGEYSLLKQRLQIELSERPHDAIPWQRMMDLEAGAADWDAAIAAGRTAWSLRDSLSIADTAALQSRWVSVLWKQIARNQQARDLAAAEQLFRELAEIPLSSDERARLLWERAHLDLRREAPEHAVARLHQLLALHHESRVTVNGELAGVAVRRQLEQILKQYGSDAFRETHRAAERNLTRELSAGNVAGVMQILRHYPLLDVADGVCTKLVAENARQENWPAVWSLFEEWLSLTADAERKAAIQSQRIALLRQAGYDRSAQRGIKLSESAGAETPPWRYVERGWRHDVAVDQRPLMVQGTPPGDAFACVLLAGPQLTALERTTGAVRWRQTTETMPFWSAYTDTHLVVASKDGLAAHRLETGDRLWQVKTNALATSDDAAERLLSTPERVVVLDPPRGVMAISTTTGEIVWEFRPPRGRLQPQWGKLSDGLLLRTLEPAEFWTIDAETGRVLQSVPGKDAGWSQPPVDLGQGRFGFVTASREIWAWSAHESDRWRYRGGVSFAHADPRLLHDGERSAVLIDGTTLIGLDAATGSRRWSGGLADFPLLDPAMQTAVANGVVVAVSQRAIRALSLNSGAIVWESPLPAADAWTVSAWHGQFAAAGAGETPQLLLYDAKTGQARQALRQDRGGSRGRWYLDDDGVLFTSPQIVAAWKPLAPR